MAKAIVTEYKEAGREEGGRSFVAGKEPANAEQVISFTTATSSAAFSSGTRLIRIQVDSKSHLKISTTDGDDATTDNKWLVADLPEYFGVKEGMFVSLLAA